MFGRQVEKGMTVIYASKNKKGVAVLGVAEVTAVLPHKVRVRGYWREHGDRMVIVDMEEAESE
jgi:hypothetical protein